MRWISREDFHHLAQLRLYSIHIAQHRQHPQTLLVIPAVRGIVRDQPIDFSKCSGEILLTNCIIHEDIAQQYVLGLLFEHCVGLTSEVAARRGVIITDGCPIFTDKGDGLYAWIFRSQFLGACPMAIQLLPTPEKEGHLGEIDPALEVIRVFLGQAKILTVSAPAVAFFKLELGHRSPRTYVTGIQLEDIAQFYHGAIYIALRDKGDGALIIFLCPLLCRLAGGQKQGAYHQKDSGRELAKNTHG